MEYQVRQDMRSAWVPLENQARVVTLTSEALKTLDAMVNRAHTVESTMVAQKEDLHNLTREQADAFMHEVVTAERDAWRSLTTSLIAMLRLGGQASSDSELSLYVWNGQIAYGVIGFPKYEYVNGHASERRETGPVEWSVHS